MLEHEIRVARAAIHDIAEHAARLQRLRGEFAHERDLVVVRLANDYVSARRLRQQRAPSEQAFMARLRAVDMTRDRPYAPGKSRPRSDRLDGGWQGDPFVSHHAEDIMDRSRITVRKPRGERPLGFGVRGVHLMRAPATRVAAIRR